VTSAAQALAALDVALAAAAPVERPALVVALSARLARLGAELAQAPAPAPTEAATAMSVQQAARRLGLSARYVYRHADELGAVRAGRRLLLPQAAVERYLGGAVR